MVEGDGIRLANDAFAEALQSLTEAQDEAQRWNNHVLENVMNEEMYKICTAKRDKAHEHLEEARGRLLKARECAKKAMDYHLQLTWQFFAQNGLSIDCHTDVIQFLRYKMQAIAPTMMNVHTMPNSQITVWNIALTIVSLTTIPTTKTLSKFSLLCRVQERRECFLNCFMQDMDIISSVRRTKLILVRMI